MSIPAETIVKKANETLATNVAMYDAYGNPISAGMGVAAFDELVFSYTSGNLATIVFKKATVVVNTLTFSYSSGNVAGIVKT